MFKKKEKEGKKEKNFYMHKYSKNIYDMKLHEELLEIAHDWDAVPMHIVRVPGGWIYYHPYTGGREGTFIPYSKEFCQKESINESHEI